ncbi:APC membrane recruitment protein 3 [Rhynchocyon petersi]
MELKRRKTFIKSSLQLSHEKPYILATTAQTREDAVFWPHLLEGQQKPHSEKASLASPKLQDCERFPNKGAQLGPKKGPTSLYGTTFKLVQKSKTHDCVLGADTTASTSGPLVSSASFPGPSSSLVSTSSSGGQSMIDYRHFVPQMPFVPAVAKSIPRKRISLKHPKKCFQNLLHLCRNKTEHLASLGAKGKALSLPEDQSEAEGRLGTTLFRLGEGPGPDSLYQDLSDSELPSDSSFDLCKALCEDVASLKSFDSLTGCGEIFADESSLACLELNEGSEPVLQDPKSLQSKVLMGPFQGSVEQLASPTQNEVSDFSKFWDSLNRSVNQQQCALLGSWLKIPQEPNTDQPKLDAAGLPKLPLCSCKNTYSDSKSSSIDTGTPKSEQPESVSTSDEGYYDSFSPGLEEDKKETLSPGIPVATFPRDSYSGDALYELFYDPTEGLVNPSLSEEPCVSENLSALGTPLSMCSFHVGAEENLAPPPGPDVLGQGFLQSSWRGKECLLKLCDTELSITMGIINWLRRGPECRVPPAPATKNSSIPLDPQRTLRGLTEKLETSSEEAGPCPERNRPSDISRTTICTAPTGQRPRTQLETESLPARENKIQWVSEWGTSTMFRGPSLEHSQVSEKEGLFSPLGSVVTVAANTSYKSKTSNPSTWIGSEKELRSPVNLGCLQGPWRLDLGESTLEQDPSLMDCVTKMAALQFHQDSQNWAESHKRQNAVSGLCEQLACRSPDTLQQKEVGQLPSIATTCRSLSPDSTLHSPQEQKGLRHGLSLRWQEGTQRGQLDSVLGPHSLLPGTLSLVSNSQQE